MVSILAAIVWLLFILFYALYWSGKFSLFQNIVVTIVSLAIAGLVVALVWIVWGMSQWRRWAHH